MKTEQIIGLIKETRCQRNTRLSTWVHPGTPCPTQATNYQPSIDRTWIRILVENIFMSGNSCGKIEDVIFIDFFFKTTPLLITASIKAAVSLLAALLLSVIFSPGQQIIGMGLITIAKWLSDRPVLGVVAHLAAGLKPQCGSN